MCSKSNPHETKLNPSDCNGEQLSPLFQSYTDKLSISQFPVTSAGDSHHLMQIPDEGVSFQIQNIRQLMKAGNRFVCTCYYYTNSNKCRVRLKFIFSRSADESHVEVNLLLVPGVYDGDLDWPLNISGTIYLLDCKSEKLTEYFKFKESISSPPKNEEIQISAIPCFQCPVGSRITHEYLKSRGHIRDNSVFLKWFVKATQ